MLQIHRLRSKEIEQIDDLIVAMDLCDTHGVPTDKLETLDDLKERLRMHHGLRKHGNIKKRVSILLEISIICKWMNMIT